ncbi:glycoside hydrolase family 97 protein [Flavobacterium aquicola]|uniref:Glycosyl hydrolase family 97 n=1 Tax=Flavobacterium aquicola TaxID=1682742 RepID=A0A3E0E0C5_9FLAO|nr:glycoside hydrolase family 97 protein [Flavobacterium aquicola]REG91635.1 glycosyl hydrolase family 97 [Flavobacterium aquicola]
MKKLHFLFLFYFIFSFCVKAQELLSPNKKIKIAVTILEKSNNNQLQFKILYSKDKRFIEVLPLSSLGITRTDENFINNMELLNVSKITSIDEKYEMIIGKKKQRENFGNEQIFSFKNNNGALMNIIFRAYNDGVAFRYEFPEKTGSKINILSENTSYILPENTNRWMQEFELSYEGFYPINTDGKGKKVQHWGFPALYKVNEENVWAMISEADLSEYNCAASLRNSNLLNKYSVSYPEPRDNFKQTGAIGFLPWKSQWHTLIIGSLSDITESTLIDDVSLPNQLKNIDWIKPGAVSWIYWAENHGSKDYKKVITYIDLAVEMKWPYALIDWEWDVMDNGGNLEDAVKYAKSKGIKILLWYNSGTSWLEPTPWDRLLTPEKRAVEFAWLRKIGIDGIKVDFFAGDQQDMVKNYIAILKEAAPYQLMINFHGATLPRGWARTYPNLLTTEAVYGAEWYNNLPVLTNEAARHNTTLPFTRNVVGSMDYTPVTFSDSQHPHITTRGHELALSVVFESALQQFADRPEVYKNLPAAPKNFLTNIPVTWDDTKLIDGYPGEKAVIARRKGNIWYIGGLNGKDTPESFSLNLDKILKSKSTLEIITDNSDGSSFTNYTVNIKKGELFKINCLARGGFTAILKE